MADVPETALQRAIYERLRASPGIAALVGARVFDEVPTRTRPALPCVNFAGCQVVDVGTDCTDECEVFLDMDVWAGTRPAAMQIARALRTALLSVPLVPGPSAHLVEFTHRDTRVFLDSDGLTAHGVITFRALLDAP